jgi:hypothetical protein
MWFFQAVVMIAVLAVPGPASVAPAPSASARPALLEALTVLHDWDARRARAWTTGDVRAVRSLYVPGSAAGRADVHLLNAYRAQGLGVRRLVTQVYAVRVLHRGPGTLGLSVFDRVAGGELVRGRHAVTLRSSQPVTRIVELRRVAGRWLVAGISGSGGAPRAGRP